jgi:tetratricopeptide (TPR) repeat protein
MYLFLCCLLLPLLSFAEDKMVFSSEAFSFKKIAEFWKDGDFEMTKKQIAVFLEKYPQSILSDRLYVMLGDIHYAEKKLPDAIEAYNKISSVEFQNKVVLNRCYALFELGLYPALVGHARPALAEGRVEKDKEPEISFLLAESLFRLASSDEKELPTLLQEAKLHYLKLAQTKYVDFTLFPLAESYRLLKEYPLAASAYLELAQKHADRQEEFLFCAATAQSQYDKSLAAQTFGRIAALHGKQEKEALLNQIALLFEIGRYQEVAALSSLLEKSSQLSFYAGVSLTQLGQYNEAIGFLESYLESEGQLEADLKAALCSLIFCAQKEASPALFSKGLLRFQAAFPNDADLENLTSQYAFLLSSLKKWDEARLTFLSFLQEKSSSEAWKEFLRCSLEENQSEHLVADLQLILKQKEVLNQEEQSAFGYMLSKNFYDQKRFSEALDQLALGTQTGDSCFLKALCLKETAADPRAFITAAEEALTLSPAALDIEAIHLQLFNAYIALAEKSQDEVERAAEHLWACQNASINLENQLWLAHHYYQKVSALRSLKNEQLLYLERATSMFEKIVQLVKEPPVHEAASLRLADLYVLARAPQKKVALLEALTQNQQLRPELPWKLQRRALFELALAYELSAEEEKALSIYDSLIRTGAPSFLTKAALLHSLKLRFSRVKEISKNKSQVQEILAALKELQLKKNIETEPLHLEAGLAYAEFSTALASADERDEKALFYLNRLKEDFTSEQDIIMREYHSLRQKEAEKDSLFQGYMRFIDAQIAHLQAALARKANQTEKCLALEQKAIEGLDALVSSQDPIPSILADRAEKQIQELKKAL